MSALVALENSRSAAELPELLEALSDWLRGPGEDELWRAFVEWVGRVLPRGRFAGSALPGFRIWKGEG